VLARKAAVARSVDPRGSRADHITRG
jgi:hypothetical protein